MGTRHCSITIFFTGLLIMIGAQQLVAQNGIVRGYCVQGATKSLTSGLPSSNYLQGIVPTCTVTVYFAGTTTQVPNSQIFADNLGTVLGNPFTANVNGAWQFYASAFVQYDVVLSGGTQPNQYITPVTLTGLIPNNIASGVSLTTLGCTITPNGSGPPSSAIQTSNVACLAQAISATSNPGTSICPTPGQIFVNSSVISVGTGGGFHLLGVGDTQCTIVETASNVPILQWTSPNSAAPILVNDFSIENIGFSYSTQQSSPVNASTNSPAPAIYFNGANGSSFYRFHINDVVCGNASRCIDLAKTNGTGNISQSSWAYDIQRIVGFGTMTGGVVNLASGVAVGNPRCVIRQIYSTSSLVTEPFVVAHQCSESHFDDLEGNNGQNNALDFFGDSGEVSGVHLEVWNVTTSGIVLVSAENSNLTFSHIDWSGNICPTGSSCAGFSGPSFSFISNLAGGGSIVADEMTMFENGSSNASAIMYGIRYGSNPYRAQITRFQPILNSAASASALEVGSDPAIAVENQNQYAVVASAPAAASWPIALVANSSGAFATYTGTFTGCQPLAQQWVWIAGFTNTVNNGLFRVSTCSSTAMTVVNSAAVAETHAATAVDGVGGVALPFYGRHWNGTTSITESWTPNVVPTYNPTSGLWDSYFTFRAAGGQGRNWFNPGSWMNIWTTPSDQRDVNTNAPGLSGLMRIGGLSPGDTNGAIPVAAGYRNVGSAFLRNDFRSSANLGGAALAQICIQTSSAGAIGAETMEADQACSLMVDSVGIHNKGSALSAVLLPAQLTGFNGNAAGSDLKIQGSDGTGTAGNIPKYDAGKGLTDSGMPAGIKITNSITPAAATTSQCAEQTFTYTGLLTTQGVYVSPPSNLGAHVWIGTTRVSAGNTLAIQFCADATGGTAPAGNYIAVAF